VSSLQTSALLLLYCPPPHTPTPTRTPATTASKMTMQRLANDISSKADLPGKKVMSWEPYVPLLRKYSIDATAQPW